MKRIFLLFTLLSFVYVGLGQTTTIDFETAGSGYTPSATGGTGDTDVFNRSNPNIGGNSTFIWAAEDLTLPDPSITLDQITITSASTFSFSIDLLTPNSNDWDSTDELLITYSIDGGASQNLLWVQNTITTSNTPAALDLGFDGEGDEGEELPAITDGYGAGVGSNFATFSTSDISISGTTLDIILQFKKLTSAAEGIYIDNIKIYQNPPSISNISQTPNSNTNITSSDNVSVTADVTDDGSLSNVELHWGISAGDLNNTIQMSNSGGNTYTTDSNIPAQSDGTTVYYEIMATDIGSAITVSEKQNYQVQDPVSLPYNEDFTGQNGKGVTGGSPVSYDLEGVNWTLDINETELTASTDWFKVDNEQFSAQDIDNAQFWYSPYLDIYSLNIIDISIDVSSAIGELESNDTIVTGYEIDDGSFVTITEHIGEITGTITDFTRLTGLSNNILRIVVKVLNNVGGELYYFDNIEVYVVNRYTAMLGNWNTSTNWSNPSIPTASENALIPTTKTVTINSDNTATCNNLEIEGGATLTINSDATGTGSLLINGTVSGNVSVERYLANDQEWHYISSPVDLSGSTFSNAFTGGDPTELFRWDEDYVDGATTGWWIDIKNSAEWTGSTFNPSEGYALSYWTAKATTYTLTGVPYNSDQSVTLTKTTGSTANGWNLVGNPFPCTMAANTSADGTDNFISKNSSLFDVTYGGIYFYDETIADYVNITNASVATYVENGQAFMVKSATNGASLSFNKADRKHGSATFYKNANAEAKRLILTVNDPKDNYNQTEIVFLENMTKGLDPTYDGGKLQGNDNLALYSLLVKASSEHFAIQALPLLEDAISVGIGIEAANIGEFTFNAKNLGSFDVSTPITFEDRYAGEQVNLKENSVYTFNISEPGTYEDRFVIHFKSAVGMDDKKDDAISIYAFNRSIYVNAAGTTTGGTIAIYNAMGQLVMEEALGPAMINRMEIKDAGAYIVKVNTSEGVSTQKVIIQ